MKQLSILLLTFLALNTIAFGQDSFSSEHTIIWEERTFENLHSNNGAIKYQGFVDEAFDALQPNKVKFVHRITLPGNGDLDVRIKPIKTSPLEIVTEELVVNFQQDWEIDYMITQVGFNYFASISIVPIRKSTSGYEKLESFKLIANYTPRLKSTSRDPGMTETSVLSSGKVYKITIPKEGVYQITIFLVNLGLI